MASDHEKLFFQKYRIQMMYRKRIRVRKRRRNRSILCLMLIIVSVFNYKVTYAAKKTPELSAKQIVLGVTDTQQIRIKNTSQMTEFYSEDVTIASVSEEGIIKGAAPGTTKVVAVLTNEETGKQKKYKCKVKVKKTKLIALTFDDGPGSYTPMVLDALEKHEAKATFFVVGSRITEQTKKYIKRADELGCEIGSHTYSHPNLAKLSMRQVEKELSKTDQLVQESIGKSTSLMRPPYGSITNDARKKIKKAQILWSIDTLDWKYRNTAYVTNQVLRKAGDGDIVLMHDIHKTSAKAVEEIIVGLQKKGYKCVTISELAQARGISLDSGEKYFKMQ